MSEKQSPSETNPAEILLFNQPPKKCTFCGRELIDGKDKYMEGPNGHILCINPCAVKAQEIITKSDVKND